MAAETQNELLGQLLAVATEQLRWQKAATLPQIREAIDRSLSRTKHRRAFEACTGKATATEVAKSVGVSKQAISQWTAVWRELGIAYQDESGRIRHLISLEALGLPLEVDH